MDADAPDVPARPEEKAVSVSEFPYPGNERHRPRRLQHALNGLALWWCDLVENDQGFATLAAWLSPQETARAQRYASAALARRYVRGRAALRWVLGKQLLIEPARVAIERGRRGRPQLASHADVDFNVSNTTDVALIGVACSSQIRIGVDVESRSRVLNHAGLARKYLTAREQAAIANLSDDAKRMSFLRSWTCKEAMSKATGDALSAPLRALDVELEPTLRLVGGPAPYLPQHWELHPAPVPDAFLATVALWRAPPTPANSTSPAALDNEIGSR